jgi:hypothetical protein
MAIKLKEERTLAVRMLTSLQYPCARFKKYQ